MTPALTLKTQQEYKQSKQKTDESFGYFTKGDKQMTNKRMKICSISFSVRESQIQTMIISLHTY